MVIFFAKHFEMKQLLAAFLLGSFFTASQAQEKLNVVFILTDDHRHDAMGFTGRIPWLQTPFMDKMAKEGVWVKNATVTTALCSPSRASILTGQYAHTHTVVDNFSPLPPNLRFFPEYLQKAGYQTGFFGKWHMGHQGDQPQKGFIIGRVSRDREYISIPASISMANTFNTRTVPISPIS